MSSRKEPQIIFLIDSVGMHLWRQNCIDGGGLDWDHHQHVSSVMCSAKRIGILEHTGRWDIWDWRVGSLSLHTYQLLGKDV